ncbi:GD13987 [Drosophila simulans]|uniref:GD13987 n=1 Tax=Drosophila simulans TaxID=7240 RepID=B4QJW5_DROSI|nr:GD13987 [Drosophila simulans]
MRKEEGGSGAGGTQLSLGLAPNARHSALLVIIISDICGLTLRLSLTRRSGARGDPNLPGGTLRFWWSVRSPLHVSLPPTPPPPLPLCHGYMQMKPPQAAKIKFSKQHAHHAYRHTDNIYDGGTDTDDDECPLEATAMNPYEYESTLDCRDAGGGPAPAHAHPHAQGRTLPMSGHGRPATDLGPVHGSQTLQHQNQQNLQAAQSSHYDYEYQHLAHRPPDTANNTAQRTHGRQGE